MYVYNFIYCFCHWSDFPETEDIANPQLNLASPTILYVYFGPEKTPYAAGYDQHMTKGSKFFFKGICFSHQMSAYFKHFKPWVQKQSHLHFDSYSLCFHALCIQSTVTETP